MSTKLSAQYNRWVEIIKNYKEMIMETNVGNEVQTTNFEDLTQGMEITATIKKIVNFGAFADVGVGVDGLIHISKMADSFVNDPSDIVSIGDQVNVKIIGVDYDNKKISLSMRD